MIAFDSRLKSFRKFTKYSFIHGCRVQFDQNYSSLISLKMGIGRVKFIQNFFVKLIPLNASGSHLRSYSCEYLCFLQKTLARTVIGKHVCEIQFIVVLNQTFNLMDLKDAFYTSQMSYNLLKTELQSFIFPVPFLFKRIYFVLIFCIKIFL